MEKELMDLIKAKAEHYKKTAGFKTVGAALEKMLQNCRKNNLHPLYELFQLVLSNLGKLLENQGDNKSKNFLMKLVDSYLQIIDGDRERAQSHVSKQIEWLQRQLELDNPGINVLELIYRNMNTKILRRGDLIRINPQAYQGRKKLPRKIAGPHRLIENPKLGGKGTMIAKTNTGGFVQLNEPNLQFMKGKNGPWMELSKHNY